MRSQLYDISIYFSWRMSRKQNPILGKLSSVTKKLIETQLDVKLRRPIFSKMLSPDIGNPCIKKFHTLLEDFKFEDDMIKVRIRDTHGLENFAVEDKGNHVLGQYLLHFSVYNKDKESSAENFGYVTPILIKEIQKIAVETDEVILKVIDFRTHGQIKNNPELWPANADTGF